MKTIVTFKTKVKQQTDGPDFIDMKKAITKHDCCKAANGHSLSNSTLFPSLINRAYRAALNGQYCVTLDKLPAGISIDTTKFLAVVSLEIDLDAWRQDG